VDQIDPGILAFGYLLVGPPALVEKEEDTEAEQTVKHYIGYISGIADVEEGGSDQEDMEYVNKRHSIG
jgi:hypothetical protein